MTLLLFTEPNKHGLSARWILMGCLLSFLAHWTEVSAAEVAPSNVLPPMKQIDGTKRLVGTDVIWRTNGEVMRGKVLNTRLMFHTAYGSLSLPTESMAGLGIDKKPGHTDWIKTIHRNLFIGFMNDPIEFRTEAGTTVQWDKHLIDKIIFGQRSTEANLPVPGWYAIMQNGDMINGAPVDWKPPNEQNQQGKEIPFLEMIMVQFAPESETVRVLLRNGQEAIAIWTQDVLRMELHSGLELKLPTSQLQTLFIQNNRLPWAVRNAFEGSGSTEHAGSSQPPGKTPDGMVWIPPGRFQIGSTLNEKGRDSDEDPPTEVHITQGFWMAKLEVTQGEFETVMGTNPSGYPGPSNLPVEKVTWNEAVTYCRKLTERERESGRLPQPYVYRLPTEAEWEYACRAGSSTRFHYGDDPSETKLATYGWFIDNSQSATHPGGQLKPNAWGLYDMHGNVWEWCQDVWLDAYPGGTITDPLGSASDGWLRVARGGSWLYTATYCRSANRDSYGPDNRCSDIGFRVVLATELK